MGRSATKHLAPVNEQGCGMRLALASICSVEKINAIIVLDLYFFLA